MGFFVSPLASYSVRGQQRYTEQTSAVEISPHFVSTAAFVAASRRMCWIDNVAAPAKKLVGSLPVWAQSSHSPQAAGREDKRTKPPLSKPRVCWDGIRRPVYSGTNFHLPEVREPPKCHACGYNFLVPRDGTANAKRSAALVQHGVRVGKLSSFRTFSAVQATALHPPSPGLPRPVLRPRIAQNWRSSL